MTVRQRKWKNKDGTSSSCWMVDITYDHPNGKVERIRKTAPGTTKREAEAYERQILGALIKGEYQTYTPAPLYSDFYANWFESYCKVHLKASTHDDHRTAGTRYLVPTFGHLRLDEITTKLIADEMAKYKEGRKARSVNNMFAILRQQLNIAVKWELITKAPKFIWLKVPEDAFDFLDYDEADRLVEHAPEDFRCMILTALRTGMRVGEIMALSWDDVDFIKDVIHVKHSTARGKMYCTKNNKSRYIPMSSTLREALWSHRLVSKLKGDLVFSNTRGELMQHGSNFKPLKRACRAAGLRQISWHTLRHTFASHMVMLGVPLRIVQDLLGHSTINMTLRYSHLSPDSKSASVALLDSRETFGTTKAQSTTKVTA